MAEGLKIGEAELHWLPGGTFELDGGAMFGVVPKALWSKKYPADADNLIKMTNTPILVKTPGALTLIETGLGNKLTEKQKTIFRVHNEWDVPGGLAALGITPGEIDFVVLTHCDFDHAGGVTTQSEEGELSLTFPNAKHVVQRAEWEDVLNPNIRSVNTYWPQNIDLLKDSPNLQLVDGESEITPGITVEHTGGHTRGHQIVRINSGGQAAWHMADLLPTHAHSNPLWVMAYDNFPMDVIAQKKKLMARAAEQDAWFTFYHDPFMYACKFGEKGKVAQKWGTVEGG